MKEKEKKSDFVDFEKLWSGANLQRPDVSLGGCLLCAHWLPGFGGRGQGCVYYTPVHELGTEIEPHPFSLNIVRS